MGCSDPWARHRATAIDRAELFHSGRANLDAVFLQIHGLQRSFARADLRRFEAQRGLRTALELPQSADRATVVSALQSKLGRENITRVEVSLSTEGATETALRQWQTRLSDRSPRAEREGFEAVARSVAITLRPNGTAPESLSGIFTAIEGLLRTESAISQTMVHARSVLSAIETALPSGPALTALPIELRAEINAAKRFVQGAGPRSQAQTADSDATLRWLRGVLAPEE